MSKIIVFTLDGCPHCVTLKERLKNLSIPFSEIEVTENEELWNKIEEQTGYDLLPTVLVINDDIDESEIYIPTVDFNSEDEIIKIIQSIK